MEFELMESSRRMEDISGSIKFWRDEITEYFTEMSKFSSFELGDILIKLSSYSARVSAIRNEVVRSAKRDATAFRTQEIDPFLTECDRQFKIWSRYQAVVQYEWEMSRGQ